jgi:Mg/Co/Ni transporter MgtE
MSRRFSSLDKHRFADLIVLFLLAGFAAVYCLDAVRASTDILNLILVLPLTVIVLVLCLAQFVKNVRRPRASANERDSVKEVLPVAGLFAAYVVSLRWLGFDVGTCLFIAIFLWWHGERRWPWLIGYSVGFAFALTLFFSRMLPYPMPMLVLDTA